MIGVRGTPLTDSFEWCRWRKTKAELLRMGATEILSDREAAKRGFVVRAAKSHYASQQKK